MLKLTLRVFDFLNQVIQEDGLYIFMGFTYLLIPFMVWVLSGGLRRKLSKGKPVPHVQPIIVVQIPVGRPTPPPEPFDPFPPLQDPPRCDHDDHFLD